MASSLITAEPLTELGRLLMCGVFALVAVCCGCGYPQAGHSVEARSKCVNSRSKP